MSRVTVEYDRTGDISKLVASRVQRIIREATFSVEGHAKTEVPVDTGNLKNSISSSFEADGTRGVVATNVEYAEYVEYGTRRTAAQPFMEPAYNRVVPTVRAALDDVARELS